MIVNGGHRGSTATLASLDEKSFSVAVELKDVSQPCMLNFRVHVIVIFVIFCISNSTSQEGEAFIPSVFRVLARRLSRLARRDSREGGDLLLSGTVYVSSPTPVLFTLSRT